MPASLRPALDRRRLVGSKWTRRAADGGGRHFEVTAVLDGGRARLWCPVDDTEREVATTALRDPAQWLRGWASL